MRFGKTNLEEAHEALDQRLLKVPPCENCSRHSTLVRAVEQFVSCSECRKRLLEDVLKVAAFEVCDRCDLAQKRPSYDRGSDYFYHLIAADNGPPGEDWCPASNLWKIIRPEES